MQLSEKLKGTFCTLFFDNFSNSPLLINKLFEENIYAIGTVRSNQNHMPKRKDDKKEILIFSSQKMSFDANGLTKNLPFYYQQILKEWMERQT